MKHRVFHIGQSKDNSVIDQSFISKFLHRNGVNPSRPMGPKIRVLKFLVWHMGEME